MTRDELIEKLENITSAYNCVNDDLRDELVSFILANWKEFIPEGYKKYEGKLDYIGGIELTESSFIGDSILDRITKDHNGKQAILIIEDK